MATDIRKCTSKIYKRDSEEKNAECGTPLLLIKDAEGKDGAWICPDCDSLEHLPKSMRERIFEQ